MSGMPVQDRLGDAARWFAARRRGVMTVEERARYDAWLSDATNVAAMARVEQTWAKLGRADHFFRNTEHAHPMPERSRLVRPALLAAMCVVSLGIGVLSYSDDTGFWTTLNWTDR